MVPTAEQRRSPRFIERLSTVLVAIAGLGAAWVLTDPRITYTVGSTTFTIGSTFSADLKGMIIGQILISGFVAVISYWLGASAGTQRQAEAMSRLAEAGPPAAAAAATAATVAAQAATVAAAAASEPKSPIKATDVTVEAAGDVSVERK